MVRPCSGPAIKLTAAMAANVACTSLEKPFVGTQIAVGSANEASLNQFWRHRSRTPSSWARRTAVQNPLKSFRLKAERGDDEGLVRRHFRKLDFYRRNIGIARHGTADVDQVDDSPATRRLEIRRDPAGNPNASREPWAPGFDRDRDLRNRAGRNLSRRQLNSPPAIVIVRARAGIGAAGRGGGHCKRADGEEQGTHHSAWTSQSRVKGPVATPIHAAALSSLSAPRITIFRASSGSGRCSALASSQGARIQISRSSSVVRMTGIALGWIGSTTTFGDVVRKP